MRSEMDPFSAEGIASRMRALKDEFEEAVAEREEGLMGAEGDVIGPPEHVGSSGGVGSAGGVRAEDSLSAEDFLAAPPRAVSSHSSSHEVVENAEPSSSSPSLEKWSPSESRDRGDLPRPTSHSSTLPNGEEPFAGRAHEVAGLSGERDSHTAALDETITQLKAQGPSRTFNESKEEEEAALDEPVGLGASQEETAGRGGRSAGGTVRLRTLDEILQGHRVAGKNV